MFIEIVEERLTAKPTPIKPNDVIKLQIIVLHFFSFIDINEWRIKKEVGIDGFLLVSLFLKIGK